jgi:hypothetical protein
MAHAQAGQLATQAAQASAEILAQAVGLRPRTGNSPLNLMVVDDERSAISHFSQATVLSVSETQQHPVILRSAPFALRRISTRHRARFRS